MLLIAKRDFRNVGSQIEVIEKDDVLHPDHIHMGATFQFGPKPETPFKELKPGERELVTQLAAADCVSDATDEKVVAQIHAAAEERRVREERQSARLAQS